jgi:hypothetical protein
MDCHVNLRKSVVKVAVLLTVLFSHFLIIASQSFKFRIPRKWICPSAHGAREKVDSWLAFSFLVRMFLIFENQI